MSGPFERPWKVRFAQTDYAGIMFYPRYFEQLNGFIEDWFDEEVGTSFEAFLDDYELGTPIAGIDTKFIAPCRLGDVLTMRLAIERVGNSSVSLNILTHCEGRPHISSRLTHVCVDRKSVKTAPWPAGVKERLMILKGEADAGPSNLTA